MRRRNRGSNSSSCCIEIPAAVLFDRERGKDPAAVGAGVDPDPIRPLLDLGADGVPMDNDKAVVSVVGKERLTDPAQVRLRLLIERSPGTNAGVDEQIIAEPTGIVEGSQEGGMVGGNRRANGRN